MAAAGCGEQPRTQLSHGLLSNMSAVAAVVVGCAVLYMCTVRVLGWQGLRTVRESPVQYAWCWAEIGNGCWRAPRRFAQLSSLRLYPEVD